MKTKTKTKQKILKVFAMCILFLGNSQLLLAQNSNPTQDVCEGSIAELYFLQGTLASSNFQWTLLSGGLIQTGQGSASITIDWDLVSAVGAGPHTLSVTETDAVGCIGLAETVEITLISVPTADAGVLTADICETGDYQLVATAGTGIISWTHNGDGSFDFPASENPIYTPGPNDVLGTNTVVTLTMTVSNGPCTDATDDIILTIYDDPTANAGADASICEGFNHIISGAAATNDVSVLWTTSGTGTFTNGNTLTPEYIPSPADISAGSVTLTLTVTGNAPCTPAVSTMILTIDPTPATGPIWHN